MIFKQIFNKFWKWYERHKTLNLGIATILFGLQIIHLIWLFGDVIYFRLTGNKIFNLHSDAANPNFGEIAIIVVDYLEIPAIISTSLIYINEVRKKFNYRSFMFLIFINSQWLHLFWITDEFVIDVFSRTDTSTVLPFWIAWIAILIDYLELPVIYDTSKKFASALRNEGLVSAIEELKE